MAQPWNMRYPLIDGQGNFGNIDGDGAAAMRYTEARLGKISEEMLGDLKKDVVDFKLNFSDDEYEPKVLPARIPNLLLNGTSGIGVALACDFVPHNIVEVMGAVKAQIDNPNITVDELITYVKAPDFPTGGTIINQGDLKSIYTTGRGSVKVRGKYKIETKNKKETVVFYEIPFGVKKEKLVASIVDLVNEKSIEGISDVRDTTNKTGLSIEIDIKKGFNADVVANRLFAQTDLQSSIKVNQTCIVNKEPKLLSLKGLIEQYILHQKDVVTRRTKFELKKVNERLHIVIGLLAALTNIDDVIAIIKASSSIQTAMDELCSRFCLSEIQAKSIVEMKLRRLSGLEKLALEEEYSGLLEEKKRLERILSSDTVLSDLLKSELDTITTRYADDRRTDITHISLKKEDDDIQFVQPENVVIVLSKDGNIKKIPTKSFKIQNRNGKGIKNHEDLVLDVIKTNTIDTLMLFTSLGKMYKLVADKVPTGTNASRGVSVKTLVSMEDHDSVIAITSMKRETTAQFVVSISEQGMIKKTSILDYTKAKRSGISAVGLKEDDKISTITFLKDEQMLLVTEKGMSIRFATDRIAPVGRTAIGVRAIKLSEGDKVVAALPVGKLTDDLAIFTEQGVAKRVALKDYPIQNRDGKGTITYKPTNATGLVVGACFVEDDDNILVIGNQTSICIQASSLPTLGKGSLGNKVIKDNTVESITKF